MIEALKAAGFPGVEADGPIVHARLWASSLEFTASPRASDWRLCLQWPVRATAAQCASWTAAYPDCPMDIHLGETRVSTVVDQTDIEALRRWAAVAEDAVAQMIRWRRAQRLPGEGY
ncbi:MAG: hypothetical protein ACK4RZ_14110 [Paracoccaceae bacterium]